MFQEERKAKRASGVLELERRTWGGNEVGDEVKEDGFKMWAPAHPVGVTSSLVFLLLFLIVYCSFMIIKVI